MKRKPEPVDPEKEVVRWFVWGCGRTVRYRVKAGAVEGLRAKYGQMDCPECQEAGGRIPHGGRGPRPHDQEGQERWYDGCYRQR